MNEGEGKVSEPEAEDTARYEAQASSAAIEAPAREPDATRARDDEHVDDSTMAAVDERAATTKTEPMGRLQRKPQTGLMQDQKLAYFAGQWDRVQAGFVDDPRGTVERADRLVGEVIDHLDQLFKGERAQLESQWSGDARADTEDLRQAMQRYRDFFQMLVGR